MSEALAIPDDADLFQDADFAKAIQERTKARAKAAFHGRGFDRLIRIAEGDDDKAAMAAITLLGKLAGEFKAPRPIQLSFDEMMKRAAQVSAGPLNGITAIREGVLVGENDDSDDTD